MGRQELLKADQLKGQGLYLYEAGMAREHRTTARKLVQKIRLMSFFVPHIFVHPGNLYEEDTLYEAIKENRALLATGQILPLMREGINSLEEYSMHWRELRDAKDPKRPAFVQSQKVTENDLLAIEAKAKLFRDYPYSALEMQAPDQQEVSKQFEVAVKLILAIEPDVDEEVKNAIVERARRVNSPLGSIRSEVIDKLGYRRNPTLQRITSRINVAYFGAFAQEIDSWFSLSDRAFEDICTPILSRRSLVDKLVDFAVPRALMIGDTDALTRIKDEDFADIVSSNEAQDFRRRISNQINKSVDQLDLSALLYRNREIAEAFLDTYLPKLEQELANVIERQYLREKQWYNKTATVLKVAGVATDLLMDLSEHITGVEMPTGLGTLTGLALSAAEEPIVRNFSRTIFLQQKVQKAVQVARGAP